MNYAACEFSRQLWVKASYLKFQINKPVLRSCFNKALPDFFSSCSFSFISIDQIQGFIQCFTWESKDHSTKAFIKHRAGFC